LLLNQQTVGGPRIVLPCCSAKSRISTWTPPTRLSSSGTIRSCAASLSSWLGAGTARWLRGFVRGQKVWRVLRHARGSRRTSLPVAVQPSAQSDFTENTAQKRNWSNRIFGSARILGVERETYPAMGSYRRVDQGFFRYSGVSLVHQRLDEGSRFKRPKFRPNYGSCQENHVSGRFVDIGCRHVSVRAKSSKTFRCDGLRITS
jgi:hypothetical protein